jgi:hypothetical protein
LPIHIKNILATTKQGIDTIVKSVNDFNELLYDWIIPKLFNELYELEAFEKIDEVEIELIKEPVENNFYRIKAKKDLLACVYDTKFSSFSSKSFHLDNYAFDSKPENHLFWTLLHDNKIDKVWFTGMLTHGQTEFYINYIDPSSHTVRCYYPDFLIQLKDGPT